MKKLTALLLAVLMLAFGTSALAETLVMGTNASFPPYEYWDGDQIVGIDAEIAAAIAEKLGCELEIKDMEFAAIIGEVQTGKISFGMAGLTVNEDRKKNVDFTTSYATGIQMVIVKEGGAINTLEDIAGKQIGVQTNTTGHIFAEDEFGIDNVQPYANGAMAVQALLAGKVDCVIIDNEPAKAYVAANEGLKLLDSEYAVEDYAICVQKGNTELLNKVNAALEELIADGTVQTILDKYISAEGDAE